MSGLRILVSGASIAGPVTAYWLHKAGAHVTVVERAEELRPGGQSIDIRGHGVTIIRRMQLEESIRANTTREKGIQFVNGNDQTQAEFPAADGTERFEFTADIEILRGKLSKCFHDATKDDIEYVFSTTITNIEKQGDKVLVNFSSDIAAQIYDLVIAADGQSSSTRRLALGSDLDDNCLHSLNQWTAWFGLPGPPPSELWWRWYNAPGRRLLFTRPDMSSNRAGLCIIGHHDEMQSANRGDAAIQKGKWRKLFQDAGWHSAEILDGMDQASDFYMQQVVQIKLPTYHNMAGKRTVLCGDAGYCPSPISGMGTTSAIVGAYILAGEIAQSPHNLESAVRRYEERMRPLVEKAQALPPGAPAIANPETATGIWILNTVLKIASWPGAFKIISALGGRGNPPAESIVLPDYRFDQAGSATATSG